MSHSRKDKYIEKGTPGNQYALTEPKMEVEKALIGNFTTLQYYINSFSDDVIPDILYPAATCKNLIMTNGYAKLCVNKRAESAAGKGWNEIEDPENNLFKTDQWIIDNIDTNELTKTIKSKVTYGRFYWGIPVLNGKPLTIYHIPVTTMLKGKGSREGQFVQYYGIKDKEQWFPELDFDALKKGTLKTGYYVYMWKNEDEIYGEPEWIAGQMEIMTSKEQRRTILSHFLNDADADKIMIHYAMAGGGVTPKMVADYQAKREQFTQGSEKRGKTDHIFRNESEKEIGKAVDYIKLDKELFSAVANQFMYANKQDICAFFQVPSFMVNLKAMGGGFGKDEDVYLQEAIYIDDVVHPDQRQIVYEPFAKLFPNMNCQLTTAKLPQKTENNRTDVTIEKAAYSTIQKALDMNAELKLYETKL